MTDAAPPGDRPGSTSPSESQPALDDPFAPLLAKLRAAALAPQGALSLELRQAAAQNHGLPPALAAVVDKIARHAYRVTDEDIHALKQAGYSEDQIYELVVATAVGRACTMADAALAALRGSLAQNKL